MYDCSILPPCLGQWHSIYIFILNLPSATKICISVSACHSKINRWLLVTIDDTRQIVRLAFFFLFKFLLFAVTIKTGGKPERPDIWNDRSHRTYGTTGHMKRPESPDIWNDRTYGTNGHLERQDIWNGWKDWMTGYPKEKLERLEWSICQYIDVTMHNSPAFMAMRTEFSEWIKKQFWIHGFFPGLDPISIHAPMIRCANKLAHYK